MTVSLPASGVHVQLAQSVALHVGAIAVGVILLGAAVAQWRTGTTFGLAGKGRVSRDAEPGYFRMLLIGRIVLGVACVGSGLFLPW